MKLPRDISGGDLVKVLCHEWGYVKVHQAGSHIILQTGVPTNQRVAVPDHQNLRVGTLNAILRAVSRHKGIRREDILRLL